MKTELIKCACGSPYHSLQILGLKEEKELILAIQLNAGGFFTRVKVALNYIFKGKIQGYDEIILNKESLDELQSIINSVK